MAKVLEGAPIARAGALLSTLKVVLGPPAAEAMSDALTATPAATEMPSVPSPAMLEMVTVRVLPLPETATVPVAVTVEFNVTCPAVNAPTAKSGSTGSENVTEYVTGPAVVRLAEGAPIVTDGTLWSAVNEAAGPAAGARLPARSDAVPEANEMASVPLPVMPEMVTMRVFPVPDTLAVPAALPVAIKVTFPAAKVLALKLSSL